MRLNFNKILCVLLSIIIATGFLPVIVDADEFVFLVDELTVKVAFIPDGNFYSIDTNGNMNGFNYDYLLKIAQFTNWTYDFVIIDEPSIEEAYQTAYKMLENGEIDIIGSQEYDTNDLEYGKNHYAVVRTTLSTLANNNVVTADNYFLKDSLRAGLIEGSDKTNELFYQVMEKYEIEPIVTYVDTREEALEHLIAEEIDVLMNTDFSIYHNTLITLYSDNPTPIYFATKKGNTQLIEEIDKAVAQIQLINPTITQELQSKYFGMGHESDLIKTKLETQTLQNIPYLTIGLVNGIEPYQFKGEDNSYSGISVEILEKISQIIDVEFTYKWFSDYDKLVLAIKNQEVDIFATLPSSYTLTKNLGVTLSSPYLSNSAVWLRNSDVVDNFDHAYQFFVSDNVSNFTTNSIEFVYDPLEVFYEISKRGNNVLFCDPYIAQHYLQELNIANIEIQPITNVYSNVSMGVANHIDPVILGLLNHAILHLKDYEIDQIIYQNTILQKELTFKEIFKRYSDSLIWFVIAISSIIIFILCFYAFKFRTLSRQDSLTKLVNAGYFHDYCEENTQKLKNGCLILIDIDNFKQINDTRGHHVGDEIIKTVANTLSNRFRQNDIIARLGGDEFVILLEYKPSVDDLNERATQILADLQPVHCTLSIGGVIFNESIFYDNLYRLTDEVLYSVKENGRNGFDFKVHSS